MSQNQFNRIIRELYTKITVQMQRQHFSHEDSKENPNHPTLYSFLPQHPIAYSRNQQTTHVESQMKIDSLVRQYEFKIEKQKQSYELQELKLREEIRELSTRLAAVKSSRQSPMRRLSDSKENHCQICSGGDTVFRLKKMLAELEKDHQFCISDKKTHLETVSILKSKVEIAVEDSDRLEQENQQMKRQLRSMVSINNDYEMQKKQWEKREKQRGRRENEREMQLIEQYEHERQLRSEQDRKRREYQREKEVEEIKAKQQARVRQYRRVASVDRKQSQTADNFAKNVVQKQDRPVLMNTADNFNKKDALAILKKQLKDQLSTSFPMCEKQNSRSEVYTKIVNKKRSFMPSDNPIKRIPNKQRTILNEVDIKSSFQQEGIVENRRGNSRHPIYKYLPANEMPKNPDTFRQSQQYSFLFH